MRHGLLGGALIAAISAPWWVTILARHGIGPFLAVAAAARDATSVDLPARIFLTFQFNFTEEPYLPIVAVLGMLGLFSELIRRGPLLPIWTAAPLFFEPRSAPPFIVIPLAMLAGIGLVEVVWPALNRLPREPSRLATVALRGFLAYIFTYLLVAAYLTAAFISNSLSLQAADQAALAWVRADTPADSQFVLLTGGSAFSDPLADWFPALAQRKSLDTVFGQEWVPAVSIRREIEQYNQVQECLQEEVDCLAAWAKTKGSDFTYVLIPRKVSPSLLLGSLQHSANYALAYQNEAVLIFKRTR
jgi:hypothetical protein